MTNPWEDVITLDAVYEVYREGIRRYGGDASDPTPGCLDRSLGAAWNAEAYNDPGPDQASGLIFAGYLLFYLARNHCFADGNKRVAWTCAMRALLHHGLTVEATTDEAEALMLAVIKGDEISDGMNVVEWLADRIVAGEAVLPHPATEAATVA